MILHKIQTYKIAYIGILLSFLLIPIYAHAEEVENIFYYYPTESAYASVNKNYRKIDILAPQIYTVGYDLKLGKAEDTDILKLAKKRHLKVMPLVVQANFSKVLMSSILIDKKAQEKLIDDLIREAKRKNFIGWQFDFENINHLDREMYTEFVKMAHEKFQEKNLILSVAVIPRSTPYDKHASIQDWSSGYDIGEVSKVSDFISIMSYDDPNSKGPVASIDFVNKVLNFTLQNTPAEKISLGVPLYCWQWEFGKDRKIASVTYDISKNTQKKYKKNPVLNMYNDDYQAELFYFIKDEGKANYIWCDNEKSLEAKLNIVKNNNLRGISAWAIGQESKNIWKKLK